MLANICHNAAKALRDGDTLTADWTLVSEAIRNMAKATQVIHRVEEAPRPSVCVEPGKRRVGCRGDSTRGRERPLRSVGTSISQLH